MNILITSCSRDVTLVKAFRSALINHGGGKVVGADINPMAAALHFADEYLMVPRSDSEDFIPSLLKICKEKDIKLIISSRDAELPILSATKPQFGALGCQVMVAPPSTIKICQNKILFCRFCEENGVLIPKTYWDKKKITFPAFLKPVTGAGSRNIHKVHNLKEYEMVKELIDGEFLVQEYLDWPEYTIDLFADFNGNIISVIPRERILTVAGESYIGKTVKNDRLINSSIKLAKKLGLVGHNTLQCFFNGKEIKFIEVNPRFGGGANLGFHAGANTPEFLVRLLKGEKIEPVVTQFEDNLVMLRYTQDVFFVPSRMKGKKVKLASKRSHQKGMIFCIDVDGTVCTDKVEYEKALPIEKTIKKINELYDNGNTIILYTARGAYSGYDWSELTEKQLKSWGVKYHQFFRGKPFAHEYVDNKAVDILDWI
jgi:carbamoyl-phosphate synthase large subunit